MTCHLVLVQGLGAVPRNLVVSSGVWPDIISHIFGDLSYIISFVAGGVVGPVIDPICVAPVRGAERYRGSGCAGRISVRVALVVAVCVVMGVLTCVVFLPLFPK